MAGGQASFTQCSCGAKLLPRCWCACRQAPPPKDTAALDRPVPVASAVWWQDMWKSLSPCLCDMDGSDYHILVPHTALTAGTAVERLPQEVGGWGARGKPLIGRSLLCTLHPPEQQHPQNTTSRTLWVFFRTPYTPRTPTPPEQHPTPSAATMALPGICGCCWTAPELCCVLRPLPPALQLPPGTLLQFVCAAMLQPNPHFFNHMLPHALHAAPCWSSGCCCAPVDVHLI